MVSSYCVNFEAKDVSTAPLGGTKQHFLEQVPQQIRGYSAWEREPETRGAREIRDVKKGGGAAGGRRESGGEKLY